MLQVPDPEAAKLRRTADPCPIDTALTPMRVFAANPEEAVDDAIHTLQHRFVKDHGNEEVHRHSTKHMACEHQPVPRDSIEARRVESFFSSLSTSGSRSKTATFRIERGNLRYLIGEADAEQAISSLTTAMSSSEQPIGVAEHLARLVFIPDTEPKIRSSILMVAMLCTLGGRILTRHRHKAIC